MTDTNFLQEIIADPDNDIPRLIYADWLEERGDPRGEFIRLQCQRASLPEDATQARTRLLAREEEFLSRHRQVWSGSWPESIQLGFERGLVMWATGDVDTLLQIEQSLFAQHPITNLTIAGGNVNKLLSELTVLDRLQSLVLRQSNVADEGLKKLAQAKNLRSLNLGDTRVSDAELKNLASLDNLEELVLHRTQVTGSGMKDLAGLKKLQALVVCCSRVTGEGFKELAGLTNLKSLNLEVSQITDVGLRDVGELISLERLNLSETLISDAGLHQVSNLKNLRTLLLNGVRRITNEGMKALVPLTSLRSLWLPAPITAAGLKVLGSCENLEQLYLTTITDEELNALGQITSLRSLNAMDAARLTDAGVKELTGLKNLESLDLGGAKQLTDITPA